MDFRQIIARVSGRLSGALLLSAFLIFSSALPMSYALSPVTTNITSSGLNTTLNGSLIAPCTSSCTITGGTRPGGGPNLFHSFGNFNVGAPDTANFFNDSGLATTNILSRVTGGNPSNIFGTIQTTGFGSASLYLINPAGVLFGSTASLNVQGSFHASTADYLKMSDGNLFIANPAYEGAVTKSGTISTVLSSASPAAFGFLNPNPAGITIQGSASGNTLGVGAGQSISVVGGDIAIIGTGNSSDPAVLSAPSGHINLVSVASPGEVLLPGMQYGPNVNGDTFTTMGTINVSQGSLLNVSGDPGGTLLIRGGQLLLDNSTIAADTTGATSHGAAPAVDIAVTGDVTITKDSGGPAISAQSKGAGDAGEVRISANNFTANYQLDFDFNNFDTIALIDTRGFGSGKGGNVTITAQNNVEAQNNPALQGLFIDSSNIADGPAGDITIAGGGQVHLLFAPINGGGFGLGIGTGRGANIQITAGDLILDNTFVVSYAGQGGDITINAGTVSITQNGLINPGLDRGGNFTMNAGNVVMDGATILTGTQGAGPGGNVVVSVNTLDALNGSQIGSIVYPTGTGPGGNVTIAATDRITLSGDVFGTPSGIFTSSFGTGAAGSITVSAHSLEIAAGARINSATVSDGPGGDITVTADTLTIHGRMPFFAPDFQFSVGNFPNSAIFAGSEGNDPTYTSNGLVCVVSCGAGGNITVRAGSLNVSDGGRIDASTINEGRGGDIALITNQVQLSSGGTVSASSSGTGNAGNIQVTASDSLVMRDHSSITTATTQSDGGEIHIQVGRLVQLTDSMITTSVQGGTGNSGNITIDPQFVILQNGQIIANCSSGICGKILIVTDFFLMDPASKVSASATGGGVSGTVDIEAPITIISSTLAPLPADIVQAAGLLRASCAARFQGGNVSSFVVAGRDGLPLEPGGLLPSPLFVEGGGGARLAGSVNLPGLIVGRVFSEPDSALTSLGIGCAS